MNKISDKNVKIAIIGAGPAGLHMAKELKDKGFTNCVIFEKESRLAGKVVSCKYNNEVYELGACYVSVDYPLVTKLAQEHRCTLIPMKMFDRAVVNENKNIIYAKEYLSSAFFESYIPKFLRKVLPTLSYAPFLIFDLIRYCSQHKKLFKFAKEVINDSIPADVKNEFMKPFLAFLKEHRLHRLVPLFYFSHVSQCYGDLSTTPTYYALKWTTPTLIYSIIKENLLAKFKIDKPCLRIFPEGFENLFQSIAKKSNLTIRFNCKIIDIQRNNKAKDEKEIAITYENESAHTVEKFDYIFIACGMKNAKKFLHDRNEIEKKISDAVKNFSLTTSIIKFYPQKIFNQYATYSWINPLKNIHLSPNTVFGIRNDEKLRLAAKGIENKENSPATFFVAAQLDVRQNAKESTDNINIQLNNNLKELSDKPIELIKTCSFDYFEHFDCLGIENEYPWLLNKIQGNNRTFYLGSITSFEGINFIVEYNISLLEKFFA